MNIQRHTRNISFFILPLLFIVSVISSGTALARHADYDTLVVDDDNLDCPDAVYNTIQAAVDAAALMPGKQGIHICAGNYVEHVRIGADNSMKIRGDGADKTVIHATTSVAAPVIFAERSGQVDIEGVAIDGESNIPGNKSYGIHFVETSGKLHKMAIRNISNAAETSQGFGIRVESFADIATHVEIKNVAVTNFSRGGITGNGRSVDIVVKDSLVIGSATGTTWAANGIQVSRGATGYIKNNVIRDAVSRNTTAGGVGSGIILFCAGKTEVKNNNVLDSDIGIGIVDNQGARVKENKIYRSTSAGISLQYIGNLYGPLGCVNTPSPTVSNFVYKNKIRDSIGYGMTLANYDPVDDEPPANNFVRKNKIVNSGSDGIHVYTGAKNVFVKNKVKHSVITDIADDTVGSASFETENYWVKNKCDTSSQAGICYD